MTDGQDDDDHLPETDAIDSGSPEGVAAQTKKRSRAADKVAEFWKGVLSTEIGRAEIWRILADGGVFTSPFQVGPNGFPQPDATWFKAGQQALVFAEYHRLLLHDRVGVMLMLDENDPAFKAKARKK